MVITEIFKSIQGEGTRAGLPCIFVRLTGCNLRCVWCDTAYAFHGGRKQTLDQIIDRVSSLSSGREGNERRVPLVELTGGEPLLQPETPELAARLLGENYTVMIETSGERFVGTLPREVIKIVDVKCPDSRESGKFDMANFEVIDGKDEVKFVIASRRDYQFAKEFTERHDLAARVAEVLFSPVFPDPAGTWPGLEARELARWILEDGLPVRLGLQLHKFVWDPAAKGV
ncbi:MAG TPA: radical SAM protein [Candidatus Acidoferrum sp.]|nr:radical SAM protein [Candidatus Acidoferrum sp.]